MRRVLKVLGTILAVLLALILVWGVVFAVNSSRYAPDEQALGTREQALTAPGVTEVTGEYLLGQRYTPDRLTHPGTVVVCRGAPGLLR